MVEREESSGKVKLIVVSIIRVMLVLAFLGSFYTGRNLIAIMSALGFMLTVLPGFLESQFNVKLPGKYDVIIIAFIFGILFIGDVRGLFPFPWWDVLLNTVAAFALGFVALTVFSVLRKEGSLNTSPFVVSLLVFSFAVAIGAVWEIVEFSLDNWFGFQMQKSANDTMKDLVVNGIGAFVVSLIGYYQIKSGRENLVSAFIRTIVVKNPKVFGSKGVVELPVKEIKEMIEKGEDKSLEFKSKLRTNIYTNQVDKRIEHSVLKTVAAYLNSGGGTLLIGVGNNGELVGLNDEFSNKDKLSLHFKNLIKEHIGNEYLPFIKFDIINVDGKSVMKVNCSGSEKHVFLKHSGQEEFYVRNGPASDKLDGSTLVDYIRNNFNS